MKVFTIAGPKGGCGKSTITSALAVRAVSDMSPPREKDNMRFTKSRVGMIDLNQDQGTLSEWWTLRGRPALPYLHDAEGTLDELVSDLTELNYDFCFIDGPPYEQDLIEMSVVVADAVLIPAKLSYFDASTIDSIIGLCQRHQKPHAFIVNEYDPRRTFTNANNIALAMLEGRAPILKTRISYDARHRTGQIEGKTGAELSGDLAKEIDSLWTEAKQLVGITAPPLKVVGGRRG